MDSQPSAKRERKANFSDMEVRVLLDVYRQHQVRLNAKFSNVITHRLNVRVLDEVGQQRPQEVDRSQEGRTQNKCRGKEAKDWGRA